LDLLDSQSASLSITGDLPIRRSQTGDVNLYVTARDFKILDSKMGNVRIDSDLTLRGELRALRLEGDLGGSTGTINLDQILASTSGGAYSTIPTQYFAAPEAGADRSGPPGAETIGLASVQMDVRFTVPNDLVVKSSDLKPPNAPIGFGAVNVTLGGDLRITKE